MYVLFQAMSTLLQSCACTYCHCLAAVCSLRCVLTAACVHSHVQNIFPTRMGHPITALAKTALDQLFMAPLGIAMFFFSVNMLEGNKPAAAAQVASEKFRPVLLANYMLWPAANLINFALVPPEQRILYVNVIYVSGVGGCFMIAAWPRV